jgi:hypothetical protein
LVKVGHDGACGHSVEGVVELCLLQLKSPAFIFLRGICGFDVDLYGCITLSLKLLHEITPILRTTHVGATHGQLMCAEALTLDSV